MKLIDPTLRSSFSLPFRLRSYVIGTVALLLAIFTLLQSGGQIAMAETSIGKFPVNDSALKLNTGPRYPIGPNSIQTRYADLDGDGFLDIVAVNGGQDSPNPTLTILFGTSSGQFGAPMVIPTYMIGHTIAIGDLNGDGKPDLVVASWYQNGIAVLLNQGNRQFSAPVFSIPPDPPYPGGAQVGEFFDLAIADFDGDGLNDVVALQDQIDQRLRFFHFNGNGTLTVFATLKQNTGDTSYEGSIGVGDINGDGRPDIVLAGGGPFGFRQVAFVFGTSPGGTLLLTYGFPMPQYTIQALRIADLDNDGDMDMVMIYGGIQVFRNDGNASFTAVPRILVDNPFPPNDITIDDFNNDGEQDLAVLHGSGYDKGIMVGIRYGGGDLTYSEEKYYAVSASSSIFSADLNGDNKIDLLTASGFLDQTNYIDANQVSVLFNDNPEGFKAPLVKLWGPNFIDAGDFNNDGYRDMVSAWATYSNTTSGADISINDRRGGFYEEVRYPSPGGLRNMHAGDFNGDGKTDVVTSHLTSNNMLQLAVYFGDGSGALGTPVVTSRTQPLNNLVVGDFNNDNKDDVFVIDNTGNGFSMLSVGNGTFTTGPVLTLPDASGRVQKGDFNGDHKLDLLVAGNGDMRVWIGDGTGQFLPTVAPISGVGGAIVGDLNGDGKLDLAGTNGDAIIGVLGDGNGGFSGTFSREIPNNSVYNTVQSLVSADFDMDGFDDVALIMKDNRLGNLIVFPSGGITPSWKQPNFFGVGTATRTLVAADFNGDGKPDLEWLGDNSRGVIYNITPRQSYRTAFDYDGDGKTDASVYRPSAGDWYLLRSTAGFAAYHFGLPSDIMVPADYTGDGKTDAAVFRPSEGVWYILRSEDNTFYGAGFGTNGDIPAPGDYDGDGRADTVVYRPGAQSYWYLQQSTAGFAVVPFGVATDVPAAGDFDGDGKNDISVYRPSLGQWFRFNSHDGSFYGVQFGTLGDMIVPGDYTGDGKTDNAVFRPSTSTWYILRSEEPTFYGAGFGAAGDIPSPGDYDGDGRTDLAVYRPGAQGIFYIQQSTAGFSAIPWGITGDVPTASAYVR